MSDRVMWIWVELVEEMTDNTKPLILVAEDDQDLARFIELELTHEGYRVEVAHDGIQALTQARQKDPDLILLDLMLPGIDGWEVCRRLRTTSAVAIIMLTARSDLCDRVAGLKMGADDYVTKPFAIEELLARIEAQLRRNGSLASGTLSLADLVIDPGARQVSRAGIPVQLTTKEYELLEYLLRRQRQVLSHTQLYDTVWGYDFEGESNVLEVYIGYLRKKIDRPGLKKLIHTVRGIGYVLKSK